MAGIMVRVLLSALMLAIAGGVVAQEAYPVPPPPPDPAEWWTEAEPYEDRLDPLGRRRAGRNPPVIRAPVDASVYRLWGLMPLQTQIVHGGEAVMEAWVRPVNARRQAVVRVTLRRDGRAFVQARAGQGCCGAGIGRRVDADVELTDAQRAALRAIARDPAWRAPEHVLVQEEGAVSSVCVDGTAYDLGKVEGRRAVHLRRSCDLAEIGSVASLLSGLIEVARGHDARLDVALGDSTFALERREYAAFTARGGTLTPVRGGSLSTEAAPTAVETPELAEDDPRASVLAVDRAFAARAEQVGAAEAFREFMDPVDGRLIPRVGPVAVGGDAIYAMMGGQAPQEGRLLWTPEEAFVAESGELAATWGTARLVPIDPEAVERQGRYVTVWRRGEDGRWRGLLDLGNLSVDAP